MPDGPKNWGQQNWGQSPIRGDAADSNKQLFAELGSDPKFATDSGRRQVTKSGSLSLASIAQNARGTDFHLIPERY
jgi:hypothetical protein